MRRLRTGSALPAFALLAAGVGLTALASPAAAQDYTSGSVTGTVTDTDNKKVPSATVTLRSQAQGQTRTLTSGSGGTFAASGLTPGTYDVTVTASGYRDYTGTITIVAAQDNSVGLTLVSASADVVVTGSRVRQDFTKTTQGLNLNVPTWSRTCPSAAISPA